jgi:hypothetical protein
MFLAPSVARAASPRLGSRQFFEQARSLFYKKRLLMEKY